MVLIFLKKENQKPNRNQRRESSSTGGVSENRDPTDYFYWRMNMKIITEEFEELFADYPLYSQEHESDPKVIAKLFDPCGSASWFPFGV